MLGIPASLTKANELPDLRPFIIGSILLNELYLLKLMRLLVNSNFFIIFFVCLVSSQAIWETFFKIFIAL